MQKEALKDLVVIDVSCYTEWISSNNQLLQIWHIQRAVPQIILAIYQIETHVELFKSHEVLLFLTEHVAVDGCELIPAQVKSLQVWNRCQGSEDLVRAHQDAGAAEVVRAQVQLQQLCEETQVAWQSA